jgi:hypothetical protein
VPEEPVETFAQMIVRLGFVDAAECYRLVASIDVSGTEARASLRQWQLSDGTKAGLLRRFPSLAERARRNKPKPPSLGK